ncbi:MAG TPA: hypothetical protein VM580_13070 [Labilithrix sp.]|nr:hypothetical protein [Labilithrix sp.]
MWLVALSGVLACGTHPASSADAARNVNCAALRASAEPDLIAWDSASRAQLDKLRRQGVVAVRYEARGCDVSLELLPRCVGPKNRYVYSPFRETTTKVVQNVGELYAELPLGASNVQRLLTERGALRADTKFVGSVALPADTTISEYDLVGPECKRATHVIGALYVGGFAMGAGDAGAMKSTNLLSSETLGITREGHVKICERAETEGIELPGCSVPLRAALIPIGGNVPARLTASPAASSHETLAVDREPRIFDQRAVERVVRGKHGAVKRKCWDVAPDSVRRVTIAVTTTISPSGRVIRAEPKVVEADGVQDVASSVARCIAGEVKSWQFPEPEKEKVLTFPFHLIRQ